ncbi:cytochrome b5-like heme/steroid binding domain-containing protein, partial [Kalaharituber pfeilii]
EEDGVPPAFPSINSAQRAKAAPSKNSMPPPLLLPQIRGRNPRNPPTVLSVPLPSRQSSATLATSITAAGGLALPPTHSAPPTKPSRKVILEPGHSPLDWARLCRTASPEQLRGPGLSPGLLRVTPSMLAKHGRQRKPKNKGGGALDHGPKEMVWMALEGKVYNITAYMPFHPGGEGELLRCAGKDGTSLFMKTHSWVNIEGMLSGCLVGILVSE